MPSITERVGNVSLPIFEETGDRIVCPPIHPCLPEADNANFAAAFWETMGKVGGETGR